MSNNPNKRHTIILDSGFLASKQARLLKMLEINPQMYFIRIYASSGSWPEEGAPAGGNIM